MLDGIAVEYQNFLIISELLEFYYYFKTHGPRGQLNCALVFDESKGLFGKQNEKAFIIKDTVSKVREFGIAIVCADRRCCIIQVKNTPAREQIKHSLDRIAFRHS